MKKIVLAEVSEKSPAALCASLTFLLALNFSSLPLPVLAQGKALPKAGFSNYSRLPSVGGVHLQEGEDRPAGAPENIYNPGEPSLQHKLVRWEARHMPLKVYVSPGKRLQEEAIQTINAQRPQEVLSMLSTNPQSLLNLADCPGWTPELSAAAIHGIEQWKEFQNEGLFSFEFVNDPSLANIFLFWTDRFTGDEGVGGVSTDGNTVAVLYDANEVHSKEAGLGKPIQGTPVIIELRVSDSFDKIQKNAAHEFGHALGIKEHSPYNQDLMCVNGIARLLSNADKATIRWLYKQRPQYIMLPPVLPRFSAAYPAQSSKNTVSQNDAPPQDSGSGSSYRVNLNQSRAEAENPAPESSRQINYERKIPARESLPEKQVYQSPLRDKNGFLIDPLKVEKKVERVKKNKEAKSREKTERAQTENTDESSKAEPEKASDGY
ncbi:MAG: hypothetical protein K2X27_18610 [Candidatus Obscuribacterales bacterium]|nr:hypothetical protein [Candidatus Obscuribacterales bacterium]